MTDNTESSHIQPPLPTVKSLSLRIAPDELQLQKLAKYAREFFQDPPSMDTPELHREQAVHAIRILVDEFLNLPPIGTYGTYLTTTVMVSDHIGTAIEIRYADAFTRIIHPRHFAPLSKNSHSGRTPSATLNESNTPKSGSTPPGGTGPVDPTP